jgi:hypothetical protein
MPHFGNVAVHIVIAKLEFRRAETARGIGDVSSAAQLERRFGLCNDE